MQRLVDMAYLDANRTLETLGDSSEVGEADMLAVLDQAPDLLGRFTESSDVHVGHDVITWCNYENLLWTMGESFRRLLKRHRNLRRSAALWERIQLLCLNTRYGKGRESFTMLLGQYGGEARVPVLIELLDDPQVYGHALYAMRLLGDPRAVSAARRLLGSPKAWVRSEARKYLDKVERRRGSSA